MNPTWNRFNITSVVLGFAFLYLPIVLLVIFSFNESKLVTVWAGFSTKWYVSLFSNSGLMNAAWVTIRVGLISATVATVLGTLAALTLTRYTRFRGRVLFTGMVFAPLVMPEVITGLSLLLLFVAVGLDRGFLTVTLAHITFSMCFVAVVVQSRLLTFDRSLEEAAMDLGAPPPRTFFQITLPVILPAVISGWMLAFTLSLDDLVIASFTSGPGATTLPMKIYSQVRLGVTPEINAACTILIAIVAVACLPPRSSTSAASAAPAGRAGRAESMIPKSCKLSDEIMRAWRDVPGDPKRVAIFQNRSVRFRFLILRMSLSRNRFPLSGDANRPWAGLIGEMKGVFRCRRRRRRQAAGRVRPVAAAGRPQGPRLRLRARLAVGCGPAGPPAPRASQRQPAPRIGHDAGEPDARAPGAHLGLVEARHAARDGRLQLGPLDRQRAVGHLVEREEKPPARCA